MNMNSTYSTHTKRTPEFKAEIERLIEKHLSRLWSGDAASVGISRIIDILRNNTTDHEGVVKAGDDELIFVMRVGIKE